MFDPAFNGADLLALVGAIYFGWLFVAPPRLWPRWFKAITDPARWRALRACLPRSTLLHRTND